MSIEHWKNRALMAEDRALRLENELKLLKAAKTVTESVAKKVVKKVAKKAEKATAE